MGGSSSSLGGGDAYALKAEKAKKLLVSEVERKPRTVKGVNIGGMGACPGARVAPERSAIQSS